MTERYKKNKNTITESEQEILSRKQCAIVGCGGLGEYLAILLLRLGILNITIIDSDIFEESNLNRQLFSTENNLGIGKAEETKSRLLEVDSRAIITAYSERLTEQNGYSILRDHDLVLDGVDSISSRLMLQNVCRELKIPLVSGSIAGWYGQVTFVMPGDDTLSKIYKYKEITTIESQLGNPSFTPALIASWQVAEALKFFLNKGELLRKKMLFINLLDNEMVIIDF